MEWLFQIPILFNAVGGILVGLVTAHAGGVRKASGYLLLDYRSFKVTLLSLLLMILLCMQGFVIVSALLVTALLQFVFDGKPPSFYCLLSMPLVISSIFIYQKYPYRVKKKES